MFFFILHNSKSSLLNQLNRYIWTSEADGSFTVVKDPKGNTLGRGTRITLHLKEDAKDFLEADAIKEIAKKYSEFINFPIYLWNSHTESEEVPVEEEEAAEKPIKEETEDEDVAVEEEEETEEGNEYWFPFSLFLSSANDINCRGEAQDQDRHQDCLGLGVVEPNQAHLDP